MNNKDNLPLCVVEYIKLIIKKMKWRKKIREDVQAELIAHFEDALRDCKTSEEKETTAKELIANFGDAELIATLARRAKKRCRPMWQKAIMHCFQALGIFIICLVLYCFYISTGKPTIRVNYEHEYTNINKPTADNNENANVLYSRMDKVYVKPEKLNTDNKSDTLIDRIRDIHSIKELNNDEFTTLNKWVDDNNETIKLFVEASRKPYCWHEPNAARTYTNFFDVLIPNITVIRDTARLMSAKARLDAHKGNLDQASEDIFAIWNSAGHCLGPRTIVEQLVGVAIEIISFKTTHDLLAEYKLSPQQLKLCQNNLEQLMSKKYYANYRTERLSMDDFLQQCFTDNGRDNGHAIPSPTLEMLYSWVNNAIKNKSLLNLMLLATSAISADRKETAQLLNDFYDTAQQYAMITPWQLRQENKSLELLLNNWSQLKKVRYINTRMILPSFDNANLFFHRYNIHGQSLVLTLATLRYQQDNKTLPETLQQLKDSGYINKIPIDPFSGKEIIYKLTKDGFTIYSFGLDFDDDGGKMGIDKESKPKLWNEDDGDAVFWPVK